jgi:hypothetical protein
VCAIELVGQFDNRRAQLHRESRSMQRPCALPHSIEMGKKLTWFPPLILGPRALSHPWIELGKKLTWFPPPIPRPVSRPALAPAAAIGTEASSTAA